MSLNDNFEIVPAGGEDGDEVVDVGAHRLGGNEWFYDDFLCGVRLRTLRTRT
jgi:hypothetical protein